jgi:predicted Fe-S protein YdhL (DUF1289 family)
VSYTSLTRCDQCRRTVENATDWYKVTLKKHQRGTPNPFHREYHVNVDLCCFGCVRGYIDTQAEDAVFKAMTTADST